MVSTARSGGWDECGNLGQQLIGFVMKCWYRSQGALFGATCMYLFNTTFITFVYLEITEVRLEVNLDNSAVWAVRMD
jgi:hypothetical protein